MIRPTWDETWMAVADTIALRSVCPGRQVGAVIVNDRDRIVATGYNGPPRGLPLDEGRCPCWRAREAHGADFSRNGYGLKCPSVHAEANAFLFADRSAYTGGTIYVTAACCQDCIKLVANSGVARVVMRLDDRDLHRDPYASIDFARECGIDVRTI